MACVGRTLLSAALDLDSGFLPTLVSWSAVATRFRELETTKAKSEAADMSVRPTQNKTDLRRGPFSNSDVLRLRSRRDCRFWRRTRNTLNFFFRVAFRAGGSRLANVDAALEERAVLD
jgi:hypothetical protein